MSGGTSLTPDEGGRWLDRAADWALTFVTKLFENPVTHLSRYSDAQINEGLLFHRQHCVLGTFRLAVEGDVDLALRRSVHPLN